MSSPPSADETPTAATAPATPSDAASQVRELERKLQARDKTIETLKRRLAQQGGGTLSSPLALLEQNISLGSVIERKTGELERQRQALQKTLREVRQTQAQMLQSQKMESIGQLAAGIAHEINTPTQYVADNMSFVDMATTSLLALADRSIAVITALRGGESDDALLADFDATLRRTKLDYLRRQIPDALAQSKEGLAHIARIVSAMKAFSYPSGVDKVAVDIREVIATTVTVARSEWKYVAEIETQVDDDLPELPCRRDLIGQALLNLVVNAAHAIAETLSEGVRDKGLIRITARRFGDRHIDLSVADDGPGIPPELRERIFDPFFTTKPVGKGTGQGLAMVYTTAVDQHGGEVLCESEVGRGTCFTLRLPLSTDNDEAAPCR
ncbi:MAG: ATP-binding protein [Methyloversatilis sp.]|jgi:signal transduction histidine kinase|nr:ATP-binding protein [Methyloversatilis sp.]